jgi:hypothetical protein
VKDFRVERVTTQKVLVVIGVAGSGCFNIRAESWSGAARIEIFVEIRR